MGRVYNILVIAHFHHCETRNDQRFNCSKFLDFKTHLPLDIYCMYYIGEVNIIHSAWTNYFELLQ